MVTFNNPNLLVLSPVVLIGFLLLSLLLRRFQNAAISRFGNRQTLSRFSQFSQKTASTILIGLSLASLALAASEPSLTKSTNGSARTLNAVIVMDVSRSMLAEDAPEGQSRLRAAVQAIKVLLETYPDGRFGLVLYTDQVVDYAPTFDHRSLVTILEGIPTDYKQVRGEGSEIATALQVAAKMIEELPYRVDTIFLISDGGKSLSQYTDTIVSNKDDGVESIRSQRLHLVAIGVGGLIPAAIPVYGDDGILVGYHQYNNLIVYSTLEELTLKRIVAETSGSYHRLSGPETLVQVARRENLDSQPIAEESSANLVWVPVAVSLLLLALWLLPTKRTHPPDRRVRPRTSKEKSP